MLGKLLDNRYQLVKVLGSGGFSQTYIAEDTRRPSHPQCVVKHLKPFRSDPDFLEEVRTRFQTEAKALEKLGTHDRIPQLLACFEDSQELFLVLEFIEGHSLSDELIVSKQLSEAKVIALLQDVLEILEFVHSQQVIHRDIKPSNLIRRRSDGKVVLIDFGAVKAIQTQISNAPPTIRIGTPGYTPPEQDAGNPSYSSDLYALGMTAIQTLSGKSPSQLIDLPTGQVSWQDKLEIHRGLGAILTKMVSYSPSRRYQSAQTCLSELTKLAEPSSVALATVQVRRPDQTFSRPITADRTFSLVTGVSLIFGLVVTGVVFESSRSQMAQATLKKVRHLQAENKYQSCLDQAGGLIYDFSINSNLRNQAQQLLSQCQVAIAHQTIQKAKQLAVSGKLVNAITIAGQVSKDSQFAAETQWLIENWTQRLLALGWDQYHAGRLHKAIAYVYAIPPTAANYQTAQAVIPQWQKNWQVAEVRFNQAQQSLNQDQWQEAINIAQKSPAPDNRFWQTKLAKIVQRAEAARQAEVAKRDQQIVRTLELLNRDRDQIGRNALEKAYPDKTFKETETVSELRVRRSNDRVTFRLVVISQGWFWTRQTTAFDWQVMILKKQHIQASISNRQKLDAYRAEELNNYFLMLTEEYL